MFAKGIANLPALLAIASADDSPTTDATKGNAFALPAGVATTRALQRNLPRFAEALANLPVLNDAAASIGAISLSRNRARAVRSVPMVAALGDVLA